MKVMCMHPILENAKSEFSFHTVHANAIIYHVTVYLVGTDSIYNLFITIASRVVIDEFFRIHVWLYGEKMKE